MSSEQSGMGNVRSMYAQRRLKAIAARWDARADSWDEALQDPGCHLNEDDAYDRFTRLVKRIIAKRRKFCGIHGIIDVGCGTGLVLVDVVSEFAWGIGIDISPKMIRAARAKRIARTKFLVGDCFDLRSLCPKAGAVLSRGVLVSHYGRKQGQAILEAARSVLVPGGFLVFDFLNEAALSKYQHAPENKIWFSGAEMRLMARQAGFSRVIILGKPERRVLVLVAAIS
jgi:SAM-dependent methyltransferase